MGTDRRTGPEAEGRAVTNLRLDVVVPGTTDAATRGCICPDRFHFGLSGSLFACGGHLFDPACPVHRRAVLAEVQRIFGRPQ